VHITATLTPHSPKFEHMTNYTWFLLGMVVLWSVLLTILFRLEKRMVNPYGEIEDAPYFGDPTGYGARWIADALQCGFIMLGWARDVRGSLYRESYALLVSPERDIFVVIGVGTLGKFPFQGTWLHSPTMDGRSYYTTDNQAGVQIDLSRNWANQLAFERTFTALLLKHREWLQTLRVLPRPFTPGREFDEFRDLRVQHFRSMERAGLIRFTDASAAHFYYTLSGSAKTATWSYFLGMARRLSFGKFPRTA
jgi:hypothetical protein